MAGIFLPPTVPGALVNHAALLMGKVPVNLNYTVSEQSLASCVKQCELKTVVTSRAFLEKVKLTVPCETIFLEDIVGLERRPPARREDGVESQPAVPEAGAPSVLEKLTAWLMAKFLPVGLLERALSSNRKSEIGNRKSLDSTGHGHFFQRQHRRPQGCHVVPLQHRFKHRATGAGVRFGQTRLHPRHPAVFPFLWFHRHAVPARRARRGRGVSSEPARFPCHRPAREKIRGDVPAGDADVPANLSARLPDRRISAACAS